MTIEHVQSEDNHVLSQMADFAHLGLLLFKINVVEISRHMEI